MFRRVSLYVIRSSALNTQQEPEPSHVTGMALAHCILDKFLGEVCHRFPPLLDVPQVPPSATTREILAAKCGIVGEKDIR